jgi:predicted RNA-binding protein with TRAM domain
MAIEEGKVYEVKVPEVGWRRENLAPWGSGKIELAAPRVTIYIDTEPGKRIGVELVEVDGVVEVERAWRIR